MRKWVKGISMRQAHEQFGLYNGEWDVQMDRQWESDDGYSVSSRLLSTEWGKVEHLSITRHLDGDAGITFNGESDIPWKVKMEIKNELCGEKRPAIEVFPEQKRCIDTCDVYHLWVFEKGFEFPFGIHPKDKKANLINRGFSFSAEDAREFEDFIKTRKEAESA